MNELPQKVRDALDTLKAKSHSESGDFCAPINFYREDSDYREAVNTLELAIRQKIREEQREYIAKETPHSLRAPSMPICDTIIGLHRLEGIKEKWIRDTPEFLDNIAKEGVPVLLEAQRILSEHMENLDEIVEMERVRRVRGDTHQFVVGVEEMSELTKELCKYMRGKGNSDSISEEIADVRIMLDQLERMFDCADKVKEWRRKKIERLRARMDKEEQNGRSDG